MQLLGAGAAGSCVLWEPEAGKATLAAFKGSP